jgi:predicted heme/steroid binding protein
MGLKFWLSIYLLHWVSLNKFWEFSLESDMTEEPTFTRQQLRQYDGENGPVLVAYLGIVYDLSECPKWRTGLHEWMHFAGQDLTSEIDDAPHDEEVFQRPCVRRVGRLVE